MICQMRSTEFQNWLQSVSKPPRFLVVEDDVSFVELFERASTRFDCIIDVTDNVPAAIARLKEENFKLIILDLKLPGQSGMELLRYMWRHKIRKPIVFLSGVINQRDLDEAASMGLVAWVTKPRGDVMEYLYGLFELLNVKERFPSS